MVICKSISLGIKHVAIFNLLSFICLSIKLYSFFNILSLSYSLNCTMVIVLSVVMTNRISYGHSIVN